LDLKIFFDYRWILIDRVNPFALINNPTHLQTIIEHDLAVEWTSYDECSGLNSILIKIDNISAIKNYNSVSHIFDISSLDGYQNITLIVYDQSGNKAIDSILVKVSLLPPDFTSSLPSLTICNNPNIQFNLSIYNPRMGVQRISIVVDNIKEIYSINYGAEYKTVPFWLLINISENDYDESLTLHNVTITIYDIISRKNIATHNILIDQIKPAVWQDPLFGSIILNKAINEITISDEQKLNVYNISIYISDTYGVRYVNRNIIYI